MGFTWVRWTGSNRRSNVIRRFVRRSNTSRREQERGDIKPVAISIAIRRAKAEEAESIGACLRSAFEPFRSQYTSDAFNDTVLSTEAVSERMLRMTIYVAIIFGGEIAGTVASAREGREGHLRGMAVRPEWQGCSIAEDLLRAAEHDLRAAGCDRVTLDTTAPLQRADRFYRKNGFLPSGRVTDFFGMPLHEYVKQLAL